MSLAPPAAVAVYVSPTSLQLNISETQGDNVAIFWRQLPSDLRDNVGPTLTGGDGEIVLTNLPENSCILFTLVRSTGSGYSIPYSLPASTTQADTLAGAFARKWALTPTLTTVCGQIFSQEAPESLLGRKLQLPWTILSYTSAEYDWTFEGIYYETVAADLTVYALGHQLVENALLELHTHVDWQSLPFSNLLTKAIKVEPVDYRTASTFVRHRSGQMVWSGCINYVITLEKNHPHWPLYLHNNP